MNAKPCARETRTYRVPDTPELAKLCYCPGCPTYNECMKGNEERLYCARDQTPCEMKQLGCECGECTVAIKYALARNYYCQNGPADF